MPRLSFYIYFLVFSVFLIGFYSCDSKTNEKKAAVALSAADWTDTTTIGKVINDYYKDSVFKAGKIAMKIRDPFMNKKLPYRYLELQKVLRQRLKKISSTTAYMPVLMTGGADSAIVDFQIEWQQPNLTDSVGVFVVIDKFIHKIGTQSRYEWVKEEEYWIRKNVETPKEYVQETEYQSIDSTQLKKLQESGVIKKTF